MSGLNRTNIPQMKWAFTTRRVSHNDPSHLISDFSQARPGDLLCAEVLSIGQHTGVQLAAGRRAEIYQGDNLALCVGARYAPDQFESVPTIVDGFCDLVAAGGVAGTIVNAHSSMKEPTRLKVHGLLADRGGDVINIGQFGLPASSIRAQGPVFAVFGSSMNAGKTTTAASLVHGLTKCGFKVGAAKVTGTGAFGDYFKMADAGAVEVLDFTDVGYATTVGLSSRELLHIVSVLVSHLSAAGADAYVLEIADGVLQNETGDLVRNVSFHELVDAALFAGADALGTIAGVQVLMHAGLNVFGVSGKISASPLGCREVASQTSVPVLTRQDLLQPETLAPLLEAHEMVPVNRGEILPPEQPIAA